jgi:hypothetical protein
MHRIVLTIGLSLLFALTACDASPSKQYTLGPQLLAEDFSKDDAWETFELDVDDDFAIQDATYRARAAAGGFLWGLNKTSHTDVVLEVTASQKSTYEDNFYGLMCRADPNNNGDGYYFVVSGDGYAAIQYGHEDKVDALVGPIETTAVNKGQGINVIRAVCIGDYLALYVNQNFVAEATDTRYSSGYAGMTVGSRESDDSTVDDRVDITFDNLSIWSASLETK